jgi:hypothetical protein
MKAKEKTKVCVRDRILDPVVRQLRKNLQRIAETTWETARLLARVHDKELYLRRLDREGRSVFPLFELFCLHELGLTRSVAYDLLRIAKTFKRRDVQKHGVSKLVVILRAPLELRPVLLQKAASGASVRQLRVAIHGTTSMASGQSVRTSGRVSVRPSLVVLPGGISVKPPDHKKVDAPQQRAERQTLNEEQRAASELEQDARETVAEIVRFADSGNGDRLIHRLQLARCREVKLSKRQRDEVRAACDRLVDRIKDAACELLQSKGS